MRKLTTIFAASFLWAVLPCSAQAFAYTCNYGSPTAVPASRKPTLYCRADIYAADIQQGTHLYMLTGAAAVVQNGFASAIPLMTFRPYTVPEAYITYIVRTPDMPEWFFWITAIFTGWDTASMPSEIYQGPVEKSAGADLGPL